MLKVGGGNVAALEIESFLSTHPAVRMVQCGGNAGATRPAETGRDDEAVIGAYSA